MAVTEKYYDGAQWVDVTGLTVYVSGGGTAVTEKDVNFYDYDGTLIAGYTIAEANALSALPDGPDHTSDGLTFQEWNYTLSQVNATTSNLDVGATYITTDGKTHLHITLTTVSGLAPTLYLNKSDTSTLTVDWGDGNTNTFTNSGKFNTGAHTYSAAGDYVIKLWISSGSGTYGFGDGSNNGVLYSSSVYRYCLTKTFFGESVSIGAVAFYKHYSLKIITIPQNITSVGNLAFEYCYSLSLVIIPNSVTSLGYNSFKLCYSLTIVSISDSVISIGSGVFSGDYSLPSVVIPSNVTSLGSSAFNNCYALSSATISGHITTIDNSLFRCCYALKKVTIPNTVTNINSDAFNGCYAMLEYDFAEYASVPTLSSTNAFTGINAICKMKIPSALYSAWSTATNWSTYANYMEGY